MKFGTLSPGDPTARYRRTFGYFRAIARPEPKEPLCWPVLPDRLCWMGRSYQTGQGIGGRSVGGRGWIGYSRRVAAREAAASASDSVNRAEIRA